MWHKRLRVLAPVNGKPASNMAFHWACQLARQARAQLFALYVIEVPLVFPLGSNTIRRSYDEGEAILTGIEGIARSEKCRVSATLLEARNAGPAIVLEAADRNMDLVVVGLPFRRQAVGRNLGSTSDYILKNASCQVMVCREEAPRLPAQQG